MKYIKPFTIPDYIASSVIALYFISGLFITGSYGVNWDDNLQRDNGMSNWSFITNTDRARLTENLDRYHGPAFEIFLVSLEKEFDLKDPHSIDGFFSFLQKAFCEQLVRIGGNADATAMSTNFS